MKKQNHATPSPSIHLMYFNTNYHLDSIKRQLDEIAVEKKKRQKITFLQCPIDLHATLAKTK